MMKSVSLSLLTLALLAVPAFAQPYGGAGWGDDPYGQRLRGPGERQHAEPAKKVEVTAFRAAGAAERLGKGPIVVSSPAGEDGAPRLPVYEAAVVDRLAALGYDTAVGASADGQLAEVTVSTAMVAPEEPRRKPVSGEMGVAVGNRGTATSLAIAIDLTKPKRAILSTRLDVRIRDKASGQILWEGHAIGQAREGEGGLDDGAMASRLAAALFGRFADAVEVPASSPAAL